MQSLVLSYSVRFLSPSFSLHTIRYLSIYSYSLRYELLSNEPYHWCSGFLLFSRCAFVASAFVCLFVHLFALAQLLQWHGIFVFVLGAACDYISSKVGIVTKICMQMLPCVQCNAVQYSGMYWFTHYQCGKLVFYSIIKAWKLMDCLQNGSTLSHQIK